MLVLSWAGKLGADERAGKKRGGRRTRRRREVNRLFRDAELKWRMDQVYGTKREIEREERKREIRLLGTREGEKRLTRAPLYRLTNFNGVGGGERGGKKEGQPER
jgi:hypothetical protein